MRNANTKRGKQGQHPGLILQRYLAKPVTGPDRDPRERADLFHAAIGASKDTSLRLVYKAAYARWNCSFPKDALHLAEELQTSGRLIVGLGSESVLETGLRLHHTYGVPLIPGSALKGLASHYCHEVWGQSHLPSPEASNRQFRRGELGHSLLFGTTADGGVICFHDAWITPPSLGDGALHLDVMTPHHPEWQARKVPPTDFDDPTPVTFLSVTGTFQLRISWCGPSETPLERAQEWTRLAMDLLKEALAEWGVGGKTSSGYGRLGLVPSVPKVPLLPPRQSIPRPGDKVEGVLLEEKTKKGGWRARHEPSGLDGPIQNSPDLPPGKNPGDSVMLVVALAGPREIAFRYLAEEGVRSGGQSKSHPKGPSPKR